MRSLLHLPVSMVAVSAVVLAHMAALLVVASVTAAAETGSRARSFFPRRRG